jgi:hypothetical protein
MRDPDLRRYPLIGPRSVGDCPHHPDPFAPRPYRGGTEGPGGDAVQHRGASRRTGMDRGCGPAEPRAAGAGVRRARRRIGPGRSRTRGRRVPGSRRGPGRGDAGDPHPGPTPPDPSRCSCRGAACSSAAMRFPWRGTCRSTTTPSRWCDPFSCSGGLRASGFCFRHGTNRNMALTRTCGWTGRSPLSRRSMTLCVPAPGRGPVLPTRWTSPGELPQPSACPRRR